MWMLISYCSKTQVDVIESLC